MLTRLICSLLFACALAAPAMPQANDPFALLFGEDELDAGAAQSTGQDDLLLVRLSLRGRNVADAIPTYKISSGLCLNPEAFFEALEIPVSETEPGHFTGWYLARDHTVSIKLTAPDATERVAVEPSTETPFGPCLTLETIKQHFEFDIDYDPSTLTVEVTPPIILPLEARLEREAARNLISAMRETATPDYPIIDNPYRWISWPVADVNLDLRAASAAEMATRFSFEAAGDFLKTTARLRTVSGNDTSLGQSLRLTLTRQSLAGERIGPLLVRSVALGDIALAGDTLLAEGRSGRGFILTNVPDVRADIFDVTEIRGPLPEGWDAELYENGQLLAFVTEPDENGDYLFEDVQLRPGFNRYEVRLFGPFGQTETRLIRQFVGTDLQPENETLYSLALIDGDSFLFGADVRRETALNTTPRSAGQVARATISRGLTGHLTGRVDGQIGLSNASKRETAGAVSLFASLGTAYASVRVASDGQGAPAIDTTLQRRLGPAALLSTQLTEFGDLRTSARPEGVDRRARLRLDATVPFLARPLPTQTDIEWLKLSGDASRLDVTNRISGAFRRSRWTNSLTYSALSAPDLSERAVRGDVLLSRPLRDFRVRAALGYDIAPRLRPRNVSTSVQRQFGTTGFGQANLAYDFQASAASASASWSRVFQRFSLAATAGVASDKSWTAGLRIGFGLSRHRQTGRPRLTPPGQTRSGSIAPFVFVDTNGNNTLDTDERALEGASFLVANALRAETTASDGTALIAGLQTGAPLSVELQQSSLDDPFLVPRERGYAVNVRPG
ncbi:MAG: hypothetical protein AAGJ29_08475, partial [Pseudomonadota bacterium]